MQHHCASFEYLIAYAWQDWVYIFTHGTYQTCMDLSNARLWPSKLCGLTESCTMYQENYSWLVNNICNCVYRIDFYCKFYYWFPMSVWDNCCFDSPMDNILYYYYYYEYEEMYCRTYLMLFVTQNACWYLFFYSLLFFMFQSFTTYYYNNNYYY